MPASLVIASSRWNHEAAARASPVSGGVHGFCALKQAGTKGLIERSEYGLRATDGWIHVETYAVSKR